MAAPVAMALHYEGLSLSESLKCCNNSQSITYIQMDLTGMEKILVYWGLGGGIGMSAASKATGWGGGVTGLQSLY